MTNVFHWQGPSTILDKMGRIKTERQTLLDATRVNQYSDIGRSTNSDKTKERLLAVATLQGASNSAMPAAI